MDYARELIAAQSHRRMIEPRFLAKRVTPFEIVRADTTAASASTANGPNAHAEAGKGQGVSR